MKRETLHDLLDFDIDRYLNPYIPHNHLYILPRPLQQFLGYRTQASSEPPAVLRWITTFAATVAGLCLVAGAYAYAPGLAKWHPPILLASLGASAILDFNAVRSPLAQPRNAILGHTLAATVGVSISKLFQLSPHFEEITWVAGAMSCACASLVMSVTNTVHPPGGATAVLACTQATIIAMGWMFIPFVLLGSLLMMAVALLFNNILRQYPTFWWTPDELPTRRKQHEVDVEDPESLQKQVSITDSERTLRRESCKTFDTAGETDEVYITPFKVLLPMHLTLTDEEVMLLEGLREKLQAHAEVGG